MLQTISITFFLQENLHNLPQVELLRFLASVRLAANRLNEVHSFCATITKRRKIRGMKVTPTAWQLSERAHGGSQDLPRVMLEGGMTWTLTAAGFTLLQLGRNNAGLLIVQQFHIRSCTANKVLRQSLATLVNVQSRYERRRTEAHASENYMAGSWCFILTALVLRYL